MTDDIRGLLDEATDHEDRADDLRDEAAELVADRLDEVKVSVDVTYDDETGSIAAELTPTDVADLIDDSEIGVHVQPATVTIYRDDLGAGDDAGKRASTRDIIDSVDNEHENKAGAPLRAIVTLAAKHGIPEPEIIDRIEQLRRKGDAYSPTTDQYKVV